jgi:carbon starvation protein
MIFNDRIDAALAGLFMVIVVVLVTASVCEWLAVLRGRKPAVTREAPFVESSYA